MSLWRIYWEEMKGLPRGRFALAGAAALMAFLGFLAFAIAPEVLRAFGIVAFLIVPNFVAPFAAARMAGPRATRLTHSLFTAPVTQAQWLAANVLVAITVGFLYLAATAPILAVIASHVGTSGEIFQDLAPIAIGLVLAGAAIGTFLGVVFTGRSLAAPVGLATSVMLVSIMGGVFMSQVLQEASPDRALLAILHLLPHPNLLDAVSSEASGGKAPLEPGRALLAIGVTSLGLLLLAAWAYLRQQGPEDWESSPRQQMLVALVAGVVLLSPAALANTEYEVAEPGTPQVHIPGARPLNILAALGKPGDSPLALNFLSPHLDTADDPLTANEPNVRELLLLIPTDPAVAVTNFTVEITIPTWEDNGTYLWQNFTFDTLERDETAPLPGAILNGPADGIVVRIPITFTPGDPHAFSKNFYVAHVHASYDVEGENRTRLAHAEVPFHAAIPEASTHLFLACLPVPVALGAFAAIRRLRIQS